MNYTRLIVISAMLCFVGVYAYGQTIGLVRTETDPVHSSFVTATKLFGIDVLTANVPRCTGVSFELRYTHAGFVKFSGSAVDGLGRKVQSVVIPKIDTITGEGVIYVGVLTGDSVGSDGYLDPKVIHLEFVVTQAAPDSGDLKFNFASARAVVAVDSAGISVGSIIDLESEEVSYNIHGFVYVWPGDADNNGTVDTKDISLIGLYLDYGMPGNTLRSFRREPTSTLWFPQPVLAWDSTEVTYADCDGNGSVTVTDMLVVPLNFGKLSSKARGSEDTPQQSVPKAISNDYPAGALRVPVRVESYQAFLGAAGKISWNNSGDDIKILGIETGNLFGNEGFFFSRVDQAAGCAYIASGSAGMKDNLPASGVLAYIILEQAKGASGFAARADEMNGISADGYIFPMSAASSVNSGAEINSQPFYIKDDILTLGPEYNIQQSVKIYDLSGKLVYYSTTASGSSQVSVDLSGLNIGIYFLELDGKNVYKFNR